MICEVLYLFLRRQAVPTLDTRKERERHVGECDLRSALSLFRGQAMPIPDSRKELELPG